MISFRHKFIFVHIQKTAGNSIQSALSEYSDDQLVYRKSAGHVKNETGAEGLDVFNPQLGFHKAQHKHATIQDYHAKLGDRLAEFFLFTSVRNPFDRVISSTAFRTGPISRKPRPNELVMPGPQLEHLKIDGEVAVKHFIRFEELAADFSNICQSLELPSLQLPHMNASNRVDYREYYTDETRKMVEERYAEDIAYFGYRF